MHNLVFEPWDVPLLNTIILLLSGVTITIAHLYIKKGELNEMILFTAYTVVLAEFFILFQAFEYFMSDFDISDGIYGSTFFMCTGFHGFHVIIGTIFISVILYRMIQVQFSRAHHFGFEAAA